MSALIVVAAVRDMLFFIPNSNCVYFSRQGYAVPNMVLAHNLWVHPLYCAIGLQIRIGPHLMCLKMLLMSL